MSTRAIPSRGLVPSSADGAARTAYLREIGGLLWPPPASVDVGRARSGPPATEFLLVPDASRPRLLLPAGRPRVAAAAVRRYSEPRSRLTWLRTQALSLAIRTGIGDRLIRDRVRIYRGAEQETIETYLREVLGTDIRISLHIGPPRANRKPVLQLLTDNGDTVGFAKIGVNNLTRNLVRAEGSALATLADTDLTSMTIPSVLHRGRWRELEILVLSALPVWRRRESATAGRVTAAATELAAACGTTTGPLDAGGYWPALVARLAGAGDGPAAEPLRTVARDVTARAGDTLLTFGSWHGDWSPWNMSVLPETLLVWDWERFTTGVPVGYDLLHYALQDLLVVKRREPAGAVVELLALSPELLHPFGLSTRAATVTSVLYLIELAGRYVVDGQAEAGARLGAPEDWLLPPLVAKVATLTGGNVV